MKLYTVFLLFFRVFSFLLIAAQSNEQENSTSVSSFSLSKNPLPERLQNFRLKNVLTDIIIQVKQKQFPAHRLVLENSSPVMTKLLSSSEKNVLDLNEKFFDPDIINDLLEFLYTASLSIRSIKKARALCIASSYLQLPELLSESEKYLVNNMNADIALNMFLLANKLSLEDLRHKCVGVIADNYMTVLKSIKPFEYNFGELKLLIQEFSLILKSRKISSDTGEMISECIMNSLKQNPTMYSPSLQTFLPHMSASDVPDIYFHEICDSRLCSQYNSMKSDSKKQTSPQIYSLAGYNRNGNKLATVSRLDITSGVWTALEPISEPRGHPCGVAIGERIYIFGGLGTTGPIIKNTYRYNILDSGEVYDCSTETGSSLRPMPDKRSSCAAAELNGFIYVVGGWNIYNPNLHSTIRFNIRLNEWQVVGIMNEKRFDHQVVTFGKQIYAVGGFDTDTAEVYSPENDRWSMIASSKYRHRYPCVATHDDKIYVCSRRGFETYSPADNRWQTVAPMTRNYWGMSIVKVKDTLWALGGEVPNMWEVGSRTVLQYDLVNNNWTQASEMDAARSFFLSFLIN